MLRKLSIRDFALLSSFEQNFDQGMTVITGETGAGKSILIQAIAMCLGGSATKSMIKTGSNLAVVECFFNLSNSETASLKSVDPSIDFESNGDLTVRREIRKSGRSRFLINDQAVTKNIFSEIGHRLLDINSQHSHQILLNPGRHLELLDRAVGADKLLEEINVKYRKLKDIDQKLKVLHERSERSRERRDLIEFLIREIDSAELEVGEKERLIEERERVRYAEDIRKHLTEALGICQYESVSLASLSDGLLRKIQRAVSRDESLNDVYSEAETISVIIDDLTSVIRTRIDSLEFTPDQLNSLSERLHYLQDLEGKYRNDINGILQYRNQIENEVNSFDNIRHTITETEKTWRNSFSDYLESNTRLSKWRREKAIHLCTKIEDELKLLGMSYPRFSATFGELRNIEIGKTGEIPDDITARGTDSVEFMLSANPGVPLKPLSKIASGGELSRIMLAIKQHLTSGSSKQSIIFDEVDAGIGGEVANAVALQLRRLSANRQVITVTHLPQIAVHANQHIQVNKRTEKDSTIIEIRNLEKEDLASEIARMLSGELHAEEAHAHAISMLELAE